MFHLVSANMHFQHTVGTFRWARKLSPIRHFPKPLLQRLLYYSYRSGGAYAVSLELKPYLSPPLPPDADARSATCEYRPSQRHIREAPANKPLIDRQEVPNPDQSVEPRSGPV